MDGVLGNSKNELQMEHFVLNISIPLQIDFAN